MMDTKSDSKSFGLDNRPREWKEIPLEKVLEVKYGKNQSKVEVEESDIPILGTGGIIGWSREPLFSKESVLIGRKGTIDKPVYIDKPFWTIDTLFYTDIDFSKANAKYIYYLFQSIDWYKYNEATGVPSLSSKNISNIVFACPPLKEQQKIAEILSTVDEQIQQTDQLIEKTTELKKGLMQQLLTKGIGHTEFKQTELGKIPVQWEVKKLEKLADVKGGKRLPKGKTLVKENTGFPYIRVTDMENGSVSLSDIHYVPTDIASKIQNYRIYEGELFISVAGTLGIIGDVPMELDGANLTENANRICNISINHSYLKYYLSSTIIQNEIEKAKTTSAQPKLAIIRIKKFLITVPPLEEQKKISDILSSVDEELEGYKEEKAKYEELKKGLMQQLLTGNVRVKV